MSSLRRITMFLCAVTLLLASGLAFSQDRLIPMQDQAPNMSAPPLMGWSSVIPGTDGPAITPVLPSPQNSMRTVLVGDVVHYSFKLRVGPGRYDLIGLHRVVRETSPWIPIRTVASIFLLHGDYIDFEGVFLPGLKSPNIPDDVGAAVYLAQNNVDVWGIDQAWSLVPTTETDFSFMADWGMQRQVDDLNTAVSVARSIRRLTGNGSGGMLLLGYSSGSPVGFALLNQESLLPAKSRNIEGFIGVDQGVASDIPDWQTAMCATVANYQGLIDAGQYQDFNPFPFFGAAAQQDPDGASALIPGLTNLQAALALGTFPFFPGITGHFLAGVFDADGIPTGLQYTDVSNWLDFIASAPSYEPAAFERDEYITSCPTAGDVPWDNHLGQIRVPVLYVMAGGGFGYTGEYTLSLLGSKDITRLHVSLHDPSEALLDFGHIDLWQASNAQTVVWQPILAWIKNHSKTMSQVGM